MPIKDKMVGVHLEKPLYDLLWSIVQERGEKSASSYLRGLFLTDMQRAKRIPDEVLLVLAGGSLEG